MTAYIVTHAADDFDRVVLIPESDATPLQIAGAGQSIQADNWVEARCKVNTAGIYHDDSFGWRRL